MSDVVERFAVTLNQLTYFSACAKHQSMTQASRELHVAQSAISTAISQLETAIGTALFVRQRSKGLVLTPAGERLLHSTNKAFDVLASSIDSIQDNQNQVRGVVRLACFSTIGPILLPRLLRLLHERHPELTVDLEEGDYAQSVAALRSGRAEIAINYEFSKESDLSYVLLGHVDPYVLVSKDHQFAKRKSVALAELESDEFVLLDLPDSRDYFFKMIDKFGHSPRLRYGSQNFETVRSMVAEGLGYTILNQRPLTELTYTGKSTVALRIKDSVPSLGIVLTSLTKSGYSARSRAVADAAKEILSE